MRNLGDEAGEVSIYKPFFSSERFLRVIYVSVHGFILHLACHFMQVLHRQ